MRNKWIALAAPHHCVRLRAGLQIAQPGYTFEFPRDYFNHEDYQTEWWYYTGNVKSADGHRFGL
jgi:predicted secreted hydrolase